MKSSYEDHIAAVPWDFLLKSIDPGENSHKKTLEKVIYSKKNINATSIYLGVSFHALQRKIEHEKIVLHKKKTLTEKILEVKNQLGNKGSLEISKLFTCSRKSVCLICRKNNIHYRKKINGKSEVNGKTKR